MSLLIKHAAIADVLENEIKTGDIYIKDGRFEKMLSILMPVKQMKRSILR